MNALVVVHVQWMNKCDASTRPSRDRSLKRKGVNARGNEFVLEERVENFFLVACVPLARLLTNGSPLFLSSISHQCKLLWPTPRCQASSSQKRMYFHFLFTTKHVLTISKDKGHIICQDNDNKLAFFCRLCYKVAQS